MTKIKQGTTKGTSSLQHIKLKGSKNRERLPRSKRLSPLAKARKPTQTKNPNIFLNNISIHSEKQNAQKIIQIRKIIEDFNIIMNKKQREYHICKIKTQILMAAGIIFILYFFKGPS